MVSVLPCSMMWISWPSTVKVSSAYGSGAVIGPEMSGNSVRGIAPTPGRSGGPTRPILAWRSPGVGELFEQHASVRKWSKCPWVTSIVVRFR